MASTLAPPNSILHGAPSPANWAERFGGYYVALAAGVVAYAWLVTTVFEPPSAAAALPMIHIVFRPPPADPPPPQAPDPAPPADSPPLPELSEVAATTIRRPPEEPPPAEPAEPASLAQWRPRTPEDFDFVARAREQVTRHREQLDRRQTEVQARINRERIEAAGREFLLNTDGGKAGIIRTFDFAGFPRQVTAPLLTRYGITVENRHVTPEKNARKFLNSATLEDGTFTNVQREGYYDVLVFSTKAVALMASKELAALGARGYSPRDARIRKVVFGVVMRNDGEYDLDVIDLEVEKLR